MNKQDIIDEAVSVGLGWGDRQGWHGVATAAAQFVYEKLMSPPPAEPVYDLPVMECLAEILASEFRGNRDERILPELQRLFDRGKDRGPGGILGTAICNCQTTRPTSSKEENSLVDELSGMARARGLNAQRSVAAEEEAAKERAWRDDIRRG